MPAPTKVFAEDIIGSEAANALDGRAIAAPNGRWIFPYTNASDPAELDTRIREFANPLGSGTDTLAGSNVIDEQQPVVSFARSGQFNVQAWTERDDATGNFDIY